MLSEATAAFIQSGLSITVVGCGERLVPSIAKGAGCTVDAASGQLTVLLFADGADQVTRDLARNGRIAVCFSKPSTDQTVQVKGHDARMAPATAQDLATVRRSLDLFAEDLGPMGWDQRFVDTLFWRNPDELLAIRFTPQGAFAQTPGPAAGTRLKA